MRIGNLAGQLTLFTATAPVRAVDVEKASAGRFGSDPQAVFAVWEEFLGWTRAADLTIRTRSTCSSRTGSPTDCSPRRPVFRHLDR
ncbi:hypothetical protein AB0H34_13755 [Saccharopolyspora shandongensis]|uniref:hypothetical protein n=1 Tax=Saccharopolyspora shandongensis TaxID=418495 RepID=UPI0034025EDD